MNPLKQLRIIEKQSDNLLLAADWKKPWQVLISTMLSAQTKDETTIKISKRLYKKFNSLEKLANAKLKDIKSIIKPVNYYKTKAKNIKKTVQILIKSYKGKIPHKIEALLELPGVGRKTANVFLAVQGHDAIGVDTHLAYCSRRLGWSKHKNPHKIEEDLKHLFPKKYWKSLNWIIVRFGRTYSRNEQNKILDSLKKV